ncbi:MAG TPA: hypothetical protein VFV63_05750 [Ilumatobacteraceae bacterium]|nr:hypothetical protein [Ilumatobacteraceae bacterium]
MSTPPNKKRFIGRTSLITAAAIAGVVFAGAVAVGANIGILNAADDSEIGSLSAAGDLAPADTQVVDVYLDEPTTTTAATTSTIQDSAGKDSAADDSAVAQEFAVDVAGTVGVIPTAGGVRLGDVVANPGWTWSLAQSDPSALMVTFDNGVRTLNFTASIGPDGTIIAAVEEPIVSVSPTAPPSQFQDDDDDHDDDDYEDEDHEDEEHEDEEHEGGDDDD